MKQNIENKLALFEEKEIRKVWHNNEWYFVIEDIVFALTMSSDVKQYISKLKNRDEELYKGWVQIVHTLKVDTKGGKQSMNCADTKGILRIIQSIPSPKAEPFKQWLALVGSERIEEINDPELAVKRARDTYELKGYSKTWIDNRLFGIRSRNKLTDEWKERGATGNDYGIWTNQIYKYGFGYTAKEIREKKGLAPNANIRDQFSDIGLALTNLGEVTARELHILNKSLGLYDLKKDTKEAGNIIKKTRLDIEEKMEKKEIEQK